mgnify:CR=1 FL=1
MKNFRKCYKVRIGVQELVYKLFIYQLWLKRTKTCTTASTKENFVPVVPISANQDSNEALLPCITTALDPLTSSNSSCDKVGAIIWFIVELRGNENKVAKLCTPFSRQRNSDGSSLGGSGSRRVESLLWNKQWEFEEIRKLLAYWPWSFSSRHSYRFRWSLS